MVIYSLLQSQKGHRVIISISKSVFVYWKLFPTLFFHNWRSANFFNLETVQVCHIPSVERSEIRFIFLPLASCLSKLVFKNYCKQFFCFISFHFLCIYVSCLVYVCTYKYILLLYIFVKISNLRRKTNWIFWKFVKDYYGGNHKKVYIMARKISKKKENGWRNEDPHKNSHSILT